MIGDSLDEETWELEYKNRVCPMNNIDDFLAIKNDYTDAKDRESFQIEIIKCDHTIPENNCRGPTQSKALLNKIYFTMYYTDHNVEFGDINNLGSSPLRL